MILLFLSWLISMISTLGSLFFSEIMSLPPCVLCWYQRICMYPLVIMLLMGFWAQDQKVLRYAGPLAVMGWIIAFYHNLLYYNILPKSASPCMQGISCTTVQLNWFGFITIPLLSLTAFTIILILFSMMMRKQK
ncbi:MAG: disulfide oxidoreductase [Bacteriovoracaceae bacterium]